MPRRSCHHSGTVYDDYYHPENYRDGLPVVPCEACGAKRRLVVVDYSYARRAIRSKKVIYPYHKRVGGTAHEHPEPARLGSDRAHAN